MDWSAEEPSPYEDIDGRLGAWALRRLSGGQAQASFAPAGKPFLASDFGLYGSMAEARLAVAACEGCAGAPPAIDEQIADAGFVPANLGDGDGGTRRFERQSGTGRLVLCVSGEAEGKRKLSLQYHPRTGIRWSTIAMVADVQPDRTGEPPRPDVPGDPFAADLMAALAVAEARLQARGSHARPLKDGQEPPFVERLAAAREAAATAPRR